MADNELCVDPSTSWCQGPSEPTLIWDPELEEWCKEHYPDDYYCGSNEGEWPGLDFENVCKIEERSARGYCPDEEGHQEEIDTLVDECIMLPDDSCETQIIEPLSLDNATDAAETAATPDPSSPIEEAAIVQEAAAGEAALPATGVSGLESVVLVASLLLAAGVSILKRRDMS